MVNFGNLVKRLPELISYLSVILSVILAIRLVLGGLHNRYRWFLVLLCTDAVFSVANVYLGTALGAQYYKFFVPQRAIRWILYFLMAFGLYESLLINHKGIAALSKGTLGLFVVLASAGTLGLLFVDPNAAWASSYVLVRTLGVEFGVTTMVLAFTAVSFALLLWFPIPLSSNTKAYCIGLTVYFAAKAVSLHLIKIQGKDALAVLNIISLSVESACLLFWVFSLSRMGEATKATPLRNLSPEDKEALLQKLDRFDREIMRTFDRL